VYYLAFVAREVFEGIGQRTQICFERCTCPSLFNEGISYIQTGTSSNNTIIIVDNIKTLFESVEPAVDLF
jgi:hypothetical protein